MRIALVSPFDPVPHAHKSGRAHVGGVERVFAEVSRSLARRGHEVTVVCSSDGVTGREEQEGVHVVRAPRRMTIMRAPVARLWKYVPPEADLVHVAATYPFTTPSVLRRAKDLGRPSVLDFHFEPDPGTWVGRLAARVYRSVGPTNYAQADAVLVRSLSYARSAPSLARVPADRLHIVPNGVDTQRFTPQGPREEGEYILFVGRLVPYKGLEVLLHAMALHPPGLPLWVAGDGPMRAKWEALARRLKVDARFLGSVDDARLPALYRGARLTLLPSVTRQEAFGLSLLESMACGTPVVASDLPGVGDVARVGGLVARPGDADQLGLQIWQALHSPLLMRGASLASRIQEGYSWDAVTDRLLEVYGGVLAPPARRPQMRRPEVRETADPRRHPVL